MKVSKRKGAFVQFEDGTWGIDTKVKIGEEFKHFGKKGYATLSAAKADFERGKAEFISLKSLNKYEVLIFDDLLRKYNDMRRVIVNESTLGCDNSEFHVYFLPYFGGKLLRDCFNQESIENWYQELVDNPHYSNNRKAKVITRMKDLLKFAYMRKFIDAVIYQDCDCCLYQVKYSKKPQHEKVIWEESEEQAFWEVVSDYPKDYLMFRVFFTCGARLGEFLGLQVNCFNPSKKKLDIKQQAIYVPNKGLIVTDRLKTHESYRTVILPNDLASDLERYITTIGLKENDFLFFGNNRKQPLSRTNFRRKLYKYCDLAGVRKIVPHTSRHLQATKLAKVATSGEMIEAAARRLGHSPEMFMNTYARHSNDNNEEDLLRKAGYDA